MDNTDDASRGDIRENVGVRHVQPGPLPPEAGSRRSAYVLSTWSVHGRCHAAKESTAAETRMGSAMRGAENPMTAFSRRIVWNQTRARPAKG